MRSRAELLAVLLRHLSMVRITAGALALAAVACTSELVPQTGQDADVAAARAAFDGDVKPILDAYCGACHAGEANIDFMRPEPDVRSHLLAWPDLVLLPSPSQSHLLDKGPHEGPALTPDQAASVLDWIQLEVVAAGGDPVDAVATARITPTPGTNTVDLAPIGLTGSSVTFLYEPLATGMYLSDIQVAAGAGGVHLVDPLFVLWDGDTAMPDPINRFGNVDLVVAEAQTSYVGGGTAVFVDVPPGAPISLSFRTATLADGTDPGGGDGGVVGGGCNDVPAFTASAQPALAAACASCHGGGDADAVAATDMRRLADLSADGQAAACAQIKTRVNGADPVNSGLFLAPDPASGTSHPFKFPSTTALATFRNAVVLWADQE